MKTRAYLVAFLASLGVMAALCGPARGQPGPGAAGKEETIISATGTARVFRTPDYLDVMIGCETVDKLASGAQAQCKATMEKVVAALNALKLSGQELQTGSVDLSPRYKEYSNNEHPREIMGYVATITMRVRTTDITAASRVIDAALTAGVNRVEYVSFGIKEALAAREEAIKLATKAAKRKAQVMAEALDLRLGRVVNASASSHQTGWWGWGGMGRYGQMSQLSQNSVGGEGRGENEDSEAVVPGKIEVWADANVTFAGVERN